MKNFLKLYFIFLFFFFFFFDIFMQRKGEGGFELVTSAS
jgi:hypothetical protein